MSMSVLSLVRDTKSVPKLLFEPQTFLYSRSSSSSRSQAYGLRETTEQVVNHRGGAGIWPKGDYGWLKLQSSRMLGNKTLEEFFYLIMGIQYLAHVLEPLYRFVVLSHDRSSHWMLLVSILTSIECSFVFIRLIFSHGIVGLRPSSLRTVTPLAHVHFTCVKDL